MRDRTRVLCTTSTAMPRDDADGSASRSTPVEVAFRMGVTSLSGNDGVLSA